MNSDFLRDEKLHPMTKLLLEDDYWSVELGKKFFVKIGFPAKDPLAGGDYYCPFDIVFEDEVFRSVSFGINSMQALELAFQGIRVLVGRFG